MSESDLPYSKCMSLTTCDYETENMECQKVMCHCQTDISLTTCDYKTKSMECQKVIWHVPTDMSLTYFDFFLKAWNVKKEYGMFRQTCHLPPVITKQKSMEYQKSICHN
jgi:hypothetical protein